MLFSSAVSVELASVRRVFVVALNCARSDPVNSSLHGGATDAGNDQGGTDDRESALKDAVL